MSCYNEFFATKNGNGLLKLTLVLKLTERSRAMTTPYEQHPDHFLRLDGGIIVRLVRKGDHWA